MAGPSIPDGSSTQDSLRSRPLARLLLPLLLSKAFALGSHSGLGCPVSQLSPDCSAVLALLHWLCWALITLVTLGEGHFIFLRPLFFLQRSSVWSSQYHLIYPSKALTTHISQGLVAPPSTPSCFQIVWFSEARCGAGR